MKIVRARVTKRGRKAEMEEICFGDVKKFHATKQVTNHSIGDILDSY